jgi:formamidopyrimidine-DNA glycosylase
MHRDIGTLRALPDPTLIATPRETVPGVIAELDARGARRPAPASCSGVLPAVAESPPTAYPLPIRQQVPRDRVMPELPDVELYKRHLDATCLGRTIRYVAVGDARILADVSATELARRVEGARITATRRHGKHLLVDLGPPGWLTLHFGMNGSLKHFTDGEDDPPYDRVRFDFGDGDHLAYVNPRLLGRVGLAPDADAFIATEGLAPDALDPQFDRATFERALAGRKRDLKSLLMDQGVVAGIGNIYSDEILFQARLNPRTRCDRLDPGACQRLFEQIKEVLETAIASGAGAERLVDRLPGSFLIPHREKGERCPRCGAEIASAKFSGRTAYFCPRCQPEPA